MHNKSSLNQLKTTENFLLHDVKTVLIQNLYNLKSHNREDNTPELLKSCIHNTETCLTLIDAAIGQYQVKLTPSTGISCFNLKELILNLSTLFQAQAKSKGLRIETHISYQLPEFFQGNTQAIQLILLNLLSNALRHTSKGQIDITLSHKMLTTKNYEIALSVKDTGIGLNKEQRQLIFTQGFTTSSNHQGLGLSICQQMAQQLSGELSVASEQGVGSVFSLVFPLTISQKKSKPNMPSSITKTMRLLVIDDDPISCQYLQSLWSSLGHQCSTASTVSNAISLLENHDFDIILMDYYLHDLDFIDRLRWIKQHTQAKIVVMSAHLTPKDEHKLSQINITDVYLKPLNEQHLKHLAREMETSRHPLNQTSETHIIDRNKTLNNFQMKEGLLEEMLTIFQEETEQSLQIIKKAYSQSKYQIIHDHLHKIRGGTCYIEVPQFTLALDKLTKKLSISGADLQPLLTELLFQFSLIKKEAPRLTKIIA